jgi:hypothetical protein
MFLVKGKTMVNLNNAFSISIVSSGELYIEKTPNYPKNFGKISRKTWEDIMKSINEGKAIFVIPPEEKDTW